MVPSICCSFGAFRPGSLREAAPARRALQREAECKVNAWIYRIAEVIDAVDIHYIDVLCVQPVRRPHTYESERITAVRETVVPVIAFGDAEGVFAAKIGTEFVVGNAVVRSRRAGLGLLFALRRGSLFRLGALLLLGSFLFLLWFGFLRLFLFWFSRVFLFVLVFLLVVLLLGVEWSGDSEK